MAVSLKILFIILLSFSLSAFSAVAFYLEPDSGGSGWQLLLWVGIIIGVFVTLSLLFTIISAFFSRYIWQPIKKLFKKGLCRK